MNPHSHRLIFNPTRGCLMAVAETSRSSGKSSASGTTRSTRTQSAGCTRRAEIQASNRPPALVSIAQAATNSVAHIALQAARNVQLLAAANTNTISNRNDSSNVGAGVNIGLGQQNGFSIQLSAAQAKGRSNGTETTYDNTQLTASNTISIKSGADTTLKGAQLAADKVTMDVGGKLAIETLQNTSTFTSEQSTSGFNMSLCLPPICYGAPVPVSGSINQSNQNLDHNYQSAVGQSGIAAGAGGFDIKVADNTDLKGAAVTSTATSDKNTLSTASLTSSDLDNHQNTNSSSSSLNLGYSGASTLATLAQNLVSNGLGNLGGAAGMPEDGSQSGKTQSVISAGNITITGTGNKSTDESSQQQVATLTSRDAKTANQTLSNTLTLQQAQAVQEQQKQAQENTQAGQLVGSVAFNVVGDIAQKNGWKDSSPQKIALHAIAGFIQASAAGQNGATGALAAMGNEAFTQAVNAYIDKALPTPTVKDPKNPTAEETAQLRENALSRKALAESAASLLGATTVALAGGNNQQIAFGGAVALNADRFNRQLHPTEAKVIKDNAARYAKLVYKTETPTEEQIQAATSMLTNTAQNLLDNNSEVLVPYFKDADDFLQTLKIEYQQKTGSLTLSGTGGEQQLFYASVEQKNQSWLNQGLADPSISGVIVRTPINPPKAGDAFDSTRDKLTGLPLDEKGRYTVRVEVGDPINGYTAYTPKFLPCATTACIQSNQNLDVTDPNTQAYLKALDAKVFKDLNTAATVGTVLVPVGALGTFLQVLGLSTSLAGGAADGTPVTTASKEALQQAAAQYLSKVYRLGDAAVNRITAAVDLAGGWQAFVDRVKSETVDKTK